MVYKGRAYVFDVDDHGRADGREPGAYEIDYLVCPPGETSRFGDGRRVATRFVRPHRPDRLRTLRAGPARA